MLICNHAHLNVDEITPFCHVEETSEGDNPSKAGLNQVQDAWLAMQLLQHAAERTEMVASIDYCKAIPDTLPGPMTCLPNPGRIICVIVQNIKYAVILAVLLTAEVAAETLFWLFEKRTE